MEPLEELKIWKQKPYMRSNYDNIHIFYDDQKYIRMKPKTQIGLSPGFLHLILKKPGHWKKENIKIEDDVTLCIETHNVIYYTLIESLISDEENKFKLHVKNGVPGDNEKWLS